MAPTSSARGLAAMAEEVRPCWAGAKAAADATMEARIIDFMVEYRFVGLYIKLWAYVGRHGVFCSCLMVGKRGTLLELGRERPTRCQKEKEKKQDTLALRRSTVVGVFDR